MFGWRSVFVVVGCYHRLQFSRGERGFALCRVLFLLYVPRLGDASAVGGTEDCRGRQLV